MTPMAVTTLSNVSATKPITMGSIQMAVGIGAATRLLGTKHSDTETKAPRMALERVLGTPSIRTAVVDRER